MRIVWSPQSLSDRDAIWKYIASSNPVAAMQVDGDLEEAIEGLAEFPELGRPGLIPGTRDEYRYSRRISVPAAAMARRTAYWLTLSSWPHKPIQTTRCSALAQRSLGLPTFLTSIGPEKRIPRCAKSSSTVNEIFASTMWLILRSKAAPRPPAAMRS